MQSHEAQEEDCEKLTITCICQQVLKHRNELHSCTFESVYLFLFQGLKSVACHVWVQWMTDQWWSVAKGKHELKTYQKQQVRKLTTHCEWKMLATSSLEDVKKSLHPSEEGRGSLENLPCGTIKCYKWWNRLKGVKHSWCTIRPSL
jgi:uncharacterized protein with von Willebrand factor type A (vWA) domain